MNSWDCRCGFHNRAFSDKCAACGGFRVNMDRAVLAHPFSDPRTNPGVCQVCGRAPAADFKFTRNQGLVFIRRRFTYQGRFCKSCATGAYRAVQTRNLTQGWFGTISFFTTIAYGLGNLSNLTTGRKQLGDPTPSDPTLETRLKGRPLALQILMHPTAWVALAVVAVAVVLAITLAGNGISSGDKAYVTGLESVNQARNSVINTANSKATAWQQRNTNQPPTADDLVATELADLKLSADALPEPDSTDLVSLQQTWETRLGALVSAERNLAANYSQQTAQADESAWNDEESAYKALTAYVKQHD
jgi:hypothetical protein